MGNHVRIYQLCPLFPPHLSQLAHTIRLLLEYTGSNYVEKLYSMGNGNASGSALTLPARAIIVPHLMNSCYPLHPCQLRQRGWVGGRSSLFLSPYGVLLGATLTSMIQNLPSVVTLKVQ